MLSLGVGLKKPHQFFFSCHSSTFLRRLLGGLLQEQKAKATAESIKQLESDSTSDGFKQGWPWPMPSLPFEKKKGSLPIWGDATMQMYGKFEGFPRKIVHCLGWCHIMKPDKLDKPTY